MTIQGSCHCGKLKFELDAEVTGAMQCNCSICRRKGYLLTFATPEVFQRVANADDIGSYSFGSHNIKHQFCRQCGCSPFGEGTGPDGKAMVAVNLRCAEGIDLGALEITEFDGASL